MSPRAVRPVDRKRWRATCERILADLPRQLGALDSAMAAFGDGFPAAGFKRAYEGEAEELNRAHAVERAFGHVQNHIAELARCGALLAELPVRAARDGEPRVAPHLEALAEAGVVSKAFAKRLIISQRARSKLEHAYVATSARDAHRAVQELADLAPPFLARFSAWFEEV